jgi:hypothetical protein
MSKLENALSVEADRIDLDRLADLVESQLGNVVGGGYSQYAGWHKKDAQTLSDS